MEKKECGWNKNPYWVKWRIDLKRIDRVSSERGRDGGREGDRGYERIEGNWKIESRWKCSLVCK